MIKDTKKWNNYVKKNEGEPYGKCCVDIARKVMEYLDKEKEFDADDLVSRADKELKGDITGFMAGAIAMMVSQCHSRGEEFKKKWNKQTTGNKMNGVKNPALLTIK
jgi:hypothetical protein